ncbi:MAG: response regulator [Flavobacterium sp.]
MRQKKILLIDDELNIRYNTTELLELKNYAVQAAANGQEALDILDNWIPDLIICDIMMPQMDGPTLHGIIKKIPTLNLVPFIFLTAQKDTNLMRKCLLQGADDFLQKPFKSSDLIAVIDAKIERFENIKSNIINLYPGNRESFLHEINTPLNGIIGLADLLAKNDAVLTKGEIKNFSQAIKTSGERLNRTLSNVILYHSIKNNLINFDDNLTCDIEDVISRTCEKLILNYPKQEKRLTLNIEQISVNISENDLQYVIYESLDNALKFSSDKKNVMLTGKIYNKLYYEVEIKDFGIGISIAELNQIGAGIQFNREENEQQGLGLGLFLSRTIVKKKKGVFSIVSKKNEGTTIKIYLPLKL